MAPDEDDEKEDPAIAKTDLSDRNIVDLDSAKTLDASPVSGEEEKRGWGDRTTPRGPRNIDDPDADVVFYANDERYETKRRLGEGGMGEVRLVADRVIGREVAMKVVHRTIAAASRKQDEVHYRFVREARVQGQLEHPAIVPVYDFGLDASGDAFFTMRRVRGVTLEQILDALRSGDEVAKKAHTKHKLLGAFVRVCLAIQFAHEYGVLHRDLKPANIMLGRHGEVYVLDWGLAKVRSASRPMESTRMRAAAEHANELGVDPSPSEASVISGVRGGETRAGSVLGTPQYMSPEQILGDQIDARADIYALGAILFEILTLEPLQGSGTITAILQRAIRGVEARASIRTPEIDVAPELEQACVRATALEQESRFKRASDLADAIDAYLSGDRDVELRQTLAEEHLTRAREASRDPSIAKRSTALQEVGRALALAPNDADALALLVGFLTEPPKSPPKEVQERVERSARASQFNMLPSAALAYGGTALLFFPLQIILGSSHLALALIPLAFWLLASVFALLSWRYSSKEQATFPVVTVCSACALAASSLLYGPLLLIPAAASVIVMGQIFQTPRHNRRFLILCNVLAVGVPTLLALLNMHPVHFAYDGGEGALTMSGGALRFTPLTMAFIGIMHVVIIIVGAIFGGSYRDQLRTLQARVHLQAWQLEQLVPAEAARHIDPALPTSK